MLVRNPILRQYFDNKGFDDDFFKKFEQQPCDVLQNIDIMVDYLKTLHDLGCRIAIYTDVDVDGIMSSVIAHAGLSELGFNTVLIYPEVSNGYGIFKSDIDNIVNNYPDVSVILTGDVGIACSDAIKYAQSKNLRVLVTDHHPAMGCSADIAVDPNLASDNYSQPDICGAYVIYKIIYAYCEKYCDASKLSDIYRLSMFAGVATISDAMPVLYQNRQLIRDSIAIMRYFYNYEIKDNTLAPPVYSDNYAHAFVGMKQLLKYFTAECKIKSAADIDEQFYGFYLSPFLNSCKRMNGNMHAVYDIFFSENISDVYNCGMPCMTNAIAYLDELNTRRRERTEKLFTEIMAAKAANKHESSAELLMDCEVYVGDYDSGLCGLLATKLMAQSGLPTLVVSSQTLKGSGRCPDGFNLKAELEKFGSEIEIKGHEGAFGVDFKHFNEFYRYIDFFNNVIKTQLTVSLINQLGEKQVDSKNISISYSPDVASDFAADLSLIRDFLDELNDYHPFGRDFELPQFDLYIDLARCQKELVFGKQGQHIKLVTEDGLEIMMFNQTVDFSLEKCRNADKQGVFVCVGEFKYDTFGSDDYDSISFFCNEVYFKPLTEERRPAC